MRFAGRHFDHYLIVGVLQRAGHLFDSRSFQVYAEDSLAWSVHPPLLVMHNEEVAYEVIKLPCVSAYDPYGRVYPGTETSHASSI